MNNPAEDLSPAIPWSRPPNSAWDESDLFLKLRTLRI